MHPLFANKKLLITYIGLCMLIIGMHFSVLFFFYHLNIGASIIDASVFTITFFAFGISLWYTVRCDIPDSLNTLSAVTNHIGTATLFVALWVLTGNTICPLILPNDIEFAQFLHTSIPFRIAIGGYGYVILILAFYLILYTRDLKERIEREGLLQTKVREAELNLLKSQINPHFLFNSLNSACSLTIYNPPKAHEMIIELSEFLRYSLANGNNRFTQLSDEISNIKRYLEIEKIRFGDKLKFEFKLDELSLCMLIPGMMLQPLFENAVKHGVYESSEPVTVTCASKKIGAFTEIVITNTFDPNSPPRQGTGTGLKNIRERLNLIYHETNLLITRKEIDTFTATLHIPDFLPVTDTFQTK